MRQARAYDVFLSYNSADRADVEHIGSLLKKNGLQVWFDMWELAPGDLFQEKVETIIQTCESAAVFVGPSGYGPWQDMEMRQCLNQFVKRHLRVIPILLPGLRERPELPEFMQRFVYLDYGGGLDDEKALKSLIWGITGQRRDLDTQDETKRAPAGVLPAGAVHFVGREEEMGKAIDALAKGRPFVISRIPAVGKSALAFRIAHSLKNQAKFHGGVRWCDVGGEVGLEEAIRAVAKELGIADIATYEPERRLPFLASHLSEQRIFLALDNVLNQEVAESFLQHFQNNAVLLTTRRRVSGDVIDLRSHHCHLSGLSTEASLELLLRVSGQQEDHLGEEELRGAARICALTGHHPMAIIFLGARALEGLLSFTALAEELNQILPEVKGRRTGWAAQTVILQHLFQTEYDRLGERNPDSQFAFRCVSIFPGNFSMEAAQEIIHCPSPRSTLKLFEDILQGSLMERVGSESFRLHDLLRAFARGKLGSAEEDRGVAERFVRRYCRFAEKHKSDLKMIAGEAKNIIAAFHHSCKAGKAKEAVALADGLDLYVRGATSEELDIGVTSGCSMRRDLWEQCVRLCRNTDSPLLPHVLWRHASSLYGNLRPTQVTRLVQEALKEARGCHDTETEANCLIILSSCYRKQGRLEEAEATVIGALQIARQVQNETIEGSCLNALGRICLNQERLEEALDYSRASLVLRRNTCILHDICGSLSLLAESLQKLDRLEEARQALKEGLDLARSSGYHNGEAFCLFRLGSVLDHLGQYEDALRCYEQSLTIREAVGSKGGEGECLHAIGYCKANLGQYEEAEHLFQQSLEIKRERDDKRGMAPPLEWLGRVAAKRGDMDQARRYALESIELYESMKSPQAEEVKKLLAEWSEG